MNNLTKRVAEGVYYIPLAWSNAWLLLKNGEGALIDTGLHKDRAPLIDALSSLSVRPEQIRSVYLTHAHCDHAGNTAYFAKLGARIYLGKVEARFLTRPMCSYAQTSPRMILRPLTALAFLIGELAYPVPRIDSLQSLQEGDVLGAPGGDLRVIACGGHTPGHVAYFRPQDGLLFSGDAILNIIPVRRVTGLSLPMKMLTDDWAAATHSAKRLAELQPNALLAGHGYPLLHRTAAHLSEWTTRL